MEELLILDILLKMSLGPHLEDLRVLENRWMIIDGWAVIDDELWMINYGWWNMDATEERQTSPGGNPPKGGKPPWGGNPPGG